MIKPRPLPGHTTVPAICWLPVPPILGVAKDGCVLAAGVMACGYYGVAGVTQRTFAETLGVPFPPVGGVAIQALQRGLQSYGIRGELVHKVEPATIVTTLTRGHILIGAQMVDRAKRLGHAVVLSGLVRPERVEPHVIVQDSNLSFPILVPLRVMVASASAVLVLRGRS